MNLFLTLPTCSSCWPAPAEPPVSCFTVQGCADRFSWSFISSNVICSKHHFCNNSASFSSTKVRLINLCSANANGIHTHSARARSLIRSNLLKDLIHQLKADSWVSVRNLDASAGNTLAGRKASWCFPLYIQGEVFAFVRTLIWPTKSRQFSDLYLMMSKI